jgi:hypothetical protein
VVGRAEQAVAAAQRHPVDQDFYLDSAALNLHDFYAGLERVFRHIAAHVDRSVPESGEWHREILLQMGLEVPGVRPPVLSAELIRALDEYLSGSVIYLVWSSGGESGKDRDRGAWRARRF